MSENKLLPERIREIREAQLEAVNHRAIESAEIAIRKAKEGKDPRPNINTMVGFALLGSKIEKELAISR